MDMIFGIVLGVWALLATAFAGWAVMKWRVAQANGASDASDLQAARQKLETIEREHADMQRAVSAIREDMASVNAKRESIEAERDGLTQRLVQDKADAIANEQRIAQDRLESAQRQHEAAIASEREQLAIQLRAVEAAKQEIQRDRETQKNQFEQLASQALKQSSEQLLQLAGERFQQQRQTSNADLEERQRAIDALVKPIQESLLKTGGKLEEIDRRTGTQHAALEQQLKLMGEASAALKDETKSLVDALKKPQVRGRYGEVQLKRVAEIAGMREWCDFSEQSSVRDSEERLKRPDMIVKLPNERVIVVDAKANILAYIEAMEAKTPEETEAQLKRFTRHMVEQVKALSSKSYWEEYSGSPDFVVMFVPGDQFLDAALAREPNLIEIAASNNVILASPSTLIGLLRAVAVGWRDHQVAEDAKMLLQLGQELHDRAATAFGHMHKLGKSIDSVVKTYNSLSGSVDKRLIPTLRRFEESGVRSGKEIPEVTSVASLPTAPTSVPLPALESADENADGLYPDGD